MNDYQEGAENHSKNSRFAVSAWLAAAFALIVISVSFGPGCWTTRSGVQLESRPVVQHYEAMRNELKTKERSGAEGGCPTCVY